MGKFCEVYLKMSDSLRVVQETGFIFQPSIPERF